MDKNSIGLKKTLIINKANSKTPKTYIGLYGIKDFYSNFGCRIGLI